LSVKELIISEFYDGTLNEHQIPLLKTMIEREVARIEPDIIITYEPGGISQHLDHIAVTKAVTQLYDEKRIHPKKLYYFGISAEMMKQWGRDGGIDHRKGARIDTSAVWAKKVEAMQAHRSQRNDYTRILERYEAIKKMEGSVWKYEHFELARTTLANIILPEDDLLNGV
jgi:LmbE family N-acetylglucosaminyl deacetylase